MRDLQTMIISGLTAGAICIVFMSLFWTVFHVSNAVGICERYGWRMEGAGPYQAKHCVDPHTHAMYAPPELLH